MLRDGFVEDLLKKSLTNERVELHGKCVCCKLARLMISVFLHLRADGCSPVFLAYGHHPLSTILHPDVPFWRQIDRTSPLTIYGKLSQHGVQAHVNGHLHSVFGQRLHMMHKSYAQGMLNPKP